MQLARAALAQNLRANAVAAQILPFGRRMRHGRQALELRQQLLGCFAAVQQHHNAALLLLDVAQAVFQAPAMRLAAGFQRVQQRQRLVHASGHFVFGIPAAFDERQMQAVALHIAIGVGHELAVRGLQRARGHFANQRFVADAVLDQIGNGADLQPMRGGKALQLGQACHGAVFVHDFANHRRRRTARHAREVAARLGMACAHEHAAFYRLNRKDVPGLHDVLRRALDGHFDGARAVGGRDARGNPLRGFDRRGKRCAVACAVAAGHRRQAQLLATLAREREAH